MGIPTPNFGIIKDAEPNMLRDYAEMVAIKGAQQQQAAEQQRTQLASQLAPYQVQNEQAAAGLNQMNLARQKRMMDYFNGILSGGSGQPSASSEPQADSNAAPAAAGEAGAQQPMAASQPAASAPAPPTKVPNFFDMSKAMGMLGLPDAADTYAKLGAAVDKHATTEGALADRRNDILGLAALGVKDSLANGANPEAQITGMEANLQRTDPDILSQVEQEIQAAGPGGFPQLLARYISGSKQAMQLLNARKVAGIRASSGTPSLALKAAQGDQTAAKALDMLASQKASSLKVGHVTLMKNGVPTIYNTDAQGNPTNAIGQAPPPFSMTGLWSPTMVPTKDGKLVPGKMNARTGQVVPFGPSDAAIPKDIQAEINKAALAARGADTRYRVMVDNEQPALQGNQQAMLNIVANHIGMTMGLQKGARITQAVWNEAQQTAPWLQRVAAKFGHDGVLTGVTLSPEQIKQMVDLGYDRRVREWQQFRDTGSQNGINLQGVVPLDVRQSLRGLGTIQPRGAVGPNAPPASQGGTGAQQGAQPPGRAVRVNGKIIGYTTDGKSYIPVE